MQIVVVIVVQFSPILSVCYPSRRPSVHLLTSFKGNIKHHFLTPPSAHLLPTSYYPWYFIHGYTLSLNCLLCVSFPLICLKILWEQSQLLFISWFHCLPLEYGRSSMNGLKEVDGWIDGNKEEWKGGSRNKLKVTRYICFRALFHLNPHTLSNITLA